MIHAALRTRWWRRMRAVHQRVRGSREVAAGMWPCFVPRCSGRLRTGHVLGVSIMHHGCGRREGVCARREGVCGRPQDAAAVHPSVWGHVCLVWLIRRYGGLGTKGWRATSATGHDGQWQTALREHAHAVACAQPSSPSGMLALLRPPRTSKHESGGPRMTKCHSNRSSSNASAMNSGESSCWFSFSSCRIRLTAGFLGLAACAMMAD